MFKEEEGRRTCFGAGVSNGAESAARRGGGGRRRRVGSPWAEPEGRACHGGHRRPPSVVLSAVVRAAGAPRWGRTVVDGPLDLFRACVCCAEESSLARTASQAPQSNFGHATSCVRLTASSESGQE